MKLMVTLPAIALALALAGCEKATDFQLQGWVEAETVFVSPDEQGRVEVLNVRQAAALLKVTPGGLRRARRAGRVKGVRINEKEWGFYTSELHRYLNRYNRL